MIKSIVVCLWLFICAFSSVSVADELTHFSSELHKIRYQNLIEELRCPKCQNQNLADSASGISVDLRDQVHKMIEEGRGDQEIIDFMVARYGEFVLYRPQHSAANFLLWYGPFIFLGIGFLAFLRVVTNNRKNREARL